MVDLAGGGSGRACARACPRVDVWRWKLVSILLSSPLQLLCGRSCRQSDRDWERSLRQNTDVVRGGTPARPCRVRPAPPFTRKPSKTSVVLLVTETSRDVILCLNIIKLGNVVLLRPISWLLSSLGSPICLFPECQYLHARLMGPVKQQSNWFRFNGVLLQVTEG